ncbi:hypothetical protein KSS87_019021 [Heliosperma pusillum]|nr:hypothetical protein KSS87_019021 [Heliosperma pusillum]
MLKAKEFIQVKVTVIVQTEAKDSDFTMSYISNNKYY